MLISSSIMIFLLDKRGINSWKIFSWDQKVLRQILPGGSWPVWEDNKQSQAESTGVERQGREIDTYKEKLSVNNLTTGTNQKTKVIRSGVDLTHWLNRLQVKIDFTTRDKRVYWKILEDVYTRGNLGMDVPNLSESSVKVFVFTFQIHYISLFYSLIKDECLMKLFKTFYSNFTNFVTIMVVSVIRINILWIIFKTT